MPSSRIALELFDQTQFVLVVEVLQEKLKKLHFFSLLFFSFLFWVVVVQALKVYCQSLLEICFCFLGDLFSLPTNANQKP